MHIKSLAVKRGNSKFRHFSSSFLSLKILSVSLSKNLCNYIYIYTRTQQYTQLISHTLTPENPILIAGGLFFAVELYFSC
ncbi:hypothetical protein L6452_19731 [Arctium lappa]|uniref:Uncharacterized protein n=1 Tax=Arctium lappa TaxID=4217 RepID=A0ACB9BAN6_ARCLA|nr:hypothetical protein L6452_19731 [Arctium lappa]